MIACLLILRAIFAIMALLALAFGAPRAWRALRKPQPGDFVILLFVGLAISRLILIGKGFAYPNPPDSLPEAAMTFSGYVIGILAEGGVLAQIYWERERHG